MLSLLLLHPHHQLPPALCTLSLASGKEREVKWVSQWEREREPDKSRQLLKSLLTVLLLKHRNDRIVIKWGTGKRNNMTGEGRKATSSDWWKGNTVLKVLKNEKEKESENCSSICLQNRNASDVSARRLKIHSSVYIHTHLLAASLIVISVLRKRVSSSPSLSLSLVLVCM